MIKKFASATLVYALGPQLPKIVSFLMLPILTKHLTALDYGINGIILAYIGAFDALKDLGLSVILTNSFFKHPLRYTYIWRRLHGFIQSWSLIYSLFLIPLIFLITPAEAYNNILWIIICIIIPVIFFDTLTTIGRLYFQLNKKPLSFVTVAITGSFTAIIVNYITIVFFHLGYLGFLLGTFSAGIITGVIYFYLVYIRLKLLPSLRFNFKWIKSKLIVSLPVIPHLYAGYVLNISDRVLLDLFKISVSDIGIYAFAYSIGTYFSIFGKSLQQASGPYYMEFYRMENIEGDKKARNISYLMQGGLLLLAFLICLWMKEIFILIARNNELKNSFPLAIPIVMAYCYYPSYFFNGMKMWYRENTKALMLISVVASSLSVILNIIFIPILGIWGSVITTFLCYMFMGFSGFLYPVIRREFKVKYYSLLWIMFIILITIFLMLVKDLSLISKIYITIITLLSLFVVIYLKQNTLLRLIKI